MKLKELLQKQELLIKLYEEFLDNSPASNKELDILKLKIKVAKEEILKNNYEIKKSLDEIRKWTN